MNSRLLLTLIPLAGLLLPGCDKPQPEAAPPPRAAQVAEPPPAPVTPPPAGPSESEQKLMAQMQAMQDRQAALQQQLDSERLARLEAEITKERDLLEKERQAWRLEQELAAAKAAPPPGNSKSPRDTTPPPPTSGPRGGYDYQTFYDDLSPHGSWYDSPDYGYVWQPSVCLSDTSWRPYTRGSWASSDAGWTWCSEEPFGWATYHYGRWAQSRQRGWIWVPGDQWAPSWVSWRKNDDHVGWCPLPPETVYHRDHTWGPTIDEDCGIAPSSYIFMPVRQFDRPVLGYCETPANGLRIFGTTVNITRINIRSGHVQCDGPKYDWIRQSVRRPVPQYTLARESERPSAGRPGHHMEQNKLHFFAPKVETPWNRTLRPHTNTVALEKPDFIRAEGGVPQRLQEQFRTEITQRDQALATSSNKVVRHMVDRQQKLAEMEQSREALALEAKAKADARVKAEVRPIPDRGGPAVRPITPRTPQTGADTPVIPTGGPVQPAEPFAGKQPAPSGLRGKMEAARRQQEAEQAQAAELTKAQQLAAERTALEQQQQAAAAQAAAEARAIDQKNRSRSESLHREVEQATKAQQAAAAQAAMTEKQRQAEADAAQEATKARNTRAQMEEQRRQQAESVKAQQNATTQAAMAERQRQADAAKAQADAQRAAQTEKQREAETSVKERNRAAAMDERRQQQEADQAKARADAQRAAAEQQRREVETARAAEQAARQREAMDQQRQAQAQAEAARAEQAARQREAMEEQRQAQAQAQAEAARREAMEQQRRQAEENARRQAEEQAKRQAEENARRAEEAAKRASEAVEKDHKRGGK